ncbi:MAG: class I SAM-dependent methyltransferase [Chlorobiales bacterium]|nr:class I SAM-dependent methyltransferase [Chlorobiales bacterium]
MYHGDPQQGIDGQLHAIDTLTRVSPEQGMWLYEFCLSAKPESTLEIGMAYGYSTLYFLAAATKNRKGYHTAIDPFQRSYWHGIGLVHASTHAPRWEKEDSFRFIEERSDRAAANLARENKTYDLIFIDGNHRFDDVLVDFYLYAQVCAIGGWIIFDDMWMSSIQTVVSFIRKNRLDFKEIPTEILNVAVFQKTGDDKREWNEFVKFEVSESSTGNR